MGYSVQELINNFGDNRHQDVVDSIDYSDFSPFENPVIAKIVAASYFKLGDYGRSLSLLSQIESCFIDDIDYLSLYGACLRRSGDLDLARIQFERALKIDPNLLHVQNNFANLLIDMGDFDEAEMILKRVIDIDPSYGDACTNMQRLNEKKLTFEGKKSHVVSSASWSLADPLLMAFSNEEVQRVSLNKSIPKPLGDSKSNLAKSLPSIKDYQLAMDQLKLAQQAIADKRYDFALKLCSQANLSLPDSAAVYECVSDAYISKSLFKEAEICLLHAIQIGASSFKLFVNLVSLACMRGDYTLAQFYFERALAIDSQHSSLDQLRIQIAKGQQNNEFKPFRFDIRWPSPGE